MRNKKRSSRPITPSSTTSQTSNIPSPPFSPSSSYDASSEDEASSTHGDNDNDLEGSFLLVRNSDDEMSSSTAGTSLRDSIGDLLSDTSADDEEHLEDRTDIEELDLNINMEHSNHIRSNSDEGTIGSSELIGGSYTEGDVRTSIWSSSSLTMMSDSRSTIPGNGIPLTDSQIKLIFPNPESSWSSNGNTISDNTTPGDSFAQLLPNSVDNDKQGEQEVRDEAKRRHAERIERIRMIGERKNSGRRVDASWLKASRLWSAPSEMVSEMDSVIRDVGEYQMLSSNEDVQVVEKDLSSSSSSGEVEVAIQEEEVSVDEKGKGNDQEGDIVEDDRLLESRQKKLRKALMELASGTLNGSNKKWGLLALASMLSLALLGTLGPNIPLGDLGRRATSDNRLGQTTQDTHSGYTATQSLWLGFPPSTTTPVSTAEASSSSAALPLATQLLPDFQLIKQALSSLSTLPLPLKAHSPPLSSSDAPVSPKKIDSGHHTCRRTRSHSLSCGLAVRNENVALTVPPTYGGIKSVSKLPRVIRTKLFGQDSPIIPSPPPITSTSNSRNCTCNNTSENTDTYLTPNYFGRLGYLLEYARNLSVSTSPALDFLKGHIAITLEKELGQVYRLASDIIRKSATTGGPAVQKASEGVMIAQKAVDHALKEFITKHHLSEKTLAATSPIIDKATKGAQTVHQAVQNTYHKVFEHIKVSGSFGIKYPKGSSSCSNGGGGKAENGELNDNSAREAIAKARAGLDTLAEYVENQASLVQGQTLEILMKAQSRSLVSIKQARKGLDKIIERLLVDDYDLGEDTDAQDGDDGDRGGTEKGMLGMKKVQDDGQPMPFGDMQDEGDIPEVLGEEKSHFRRVMGKKDRRSRKEATMGLGSVKHRSRKDFVQKHDLLNRPPAKLPLGKNKEKRSKRSSFLEAVHHAAIQLVV